MLLRLPLALPALYLVLVSWEAAKQGYKFAGWFALVIGVLAFVIAPDYNEKGLYKRAAELDVSVEKILLTRAVTALFLNICAAVTLWLGGAGRLLLHPP